MVMGCLHCAMESFSRGPLIHDNPTIWGSAMDAFLVIACGLESVAIFQLAHEEDPIIPQSASVHISDVASMTHWCMCQ